MSPIEKFVMPWSSLCSQETREFRGSRCSWLFATKSERGTIIIAINTLEHGGKTGKDESYGCKIVTRNE